MNGRRVTITSDLAAAAGGDDDDDDICSMMALAT